MLYHDVLRLDLGKVLHLSTYSRSAVADQTRFLMYRFSLVYTALVLLCFVAAGTHHPAVVYHSIFRACSEQNTSGHLGSLCLSCFDSLIKGISCDTSRNGGNFNGSGPNKSLYSQQFPYVTEECLNVCTRSGFSSNPLTSGSDSSHCPSCHSLWDLTF